jgi:hypothetical protein
MPLGDVASGCLELIGRVLLEVVVHGFGDLLWPLCRVTGEFLVWLLTLGRVRLDDRHETWSGIIGLAFYIALITLVIMWVL